ncbi:MAG: hypothetical protein LBR57_03980 [Alistipes sp.]|jgi:hypothetical protein|nr:hypothetical protein [Alistipes sp.]
MNFYSLRISAPDEKTKDIARILGIEPNYDVGGWGLEIVDKDWRFDPSVIDNFLSILEGKYDELNRIGISADDISIWRLYEYGKNKECNMELHPELMLKMGSKGIIYCVSCWQKNSVIYL